MGYLRTELRTTLLPYRQHVRQLQRGGALAGLGFLLIYMIGAAYDPSHSERLRGQQLELERLEALNASLVERTARQAAALRAMRTDGAFVAHLARQELGMIQTGEIVYDFLPEPAGDDAARAATAEATAPPPAAIP